MTMLEKVARAIGDTFAAQQERLVAAAMSGNASTPVYDEVLAAVARAALEAMREPTPLMQTAGMEAQSEEHWPDPWPLAKDGYELAPDYITAGLVWWHMITAALEGK